MTSPVDRLSPRQRECLRLVWDRQATSKEIAIELGISKSTIDGYVAEAVEVLGARDRRHAAEIAFGHAARAGSGEDPARVAATDENESPIEETMDASVTARPWRVRGQRNTLTFAQTLGWIAVIAFGSLASLALATSVGNGLPAVAWPMIDAVQRLTR